MQPDVARVPQHIAIIMDGNGRWAERRHRPRAFGHRAGQKAVRESVAFCLRHSIQALSLFAFSSENWHRPEDEVGALMSLFIRALDREVDELDQQGVCIRFIGDLDAFSAAIRTRMQQAMRRTRTHHQLHLNVAVNYGGRWDMVQAAQKLLRLAADKQLDPAAIDENTLAGLFCLADQPDPDLLIRTGGERRISNFMLWQLAYTELYFTDTLWPDMTEQAFEAALTDFQQRVRRFGRTTAQLTVGA